MPGGPPLYADSLIGALMNMTKRRDEILEKEKEESASASVSVGEDVLVGGNVALLGSAHRGSGGSRRRHEERRRDLPTLPGNATFSEIVLFIEACEAGSMFEGMLPEDDFADADDESDDDAAAAAAADDDDDHFGSKNSKHRDHHRRRRRRRHFVSDARGVFALTAANAHESSWGVYW